MTAEHEVLCSDTALGDPAGGGTLRARGPIRNTGEVRIRLRVSVRWGIRGEDVRAARVFRLRPGQEKRALVSAPVDQETLERWESSSVKCRSGGKILGREGVVSVAP